MTEPKTFAEWVVLELLGHRRLAGWLTEQQIAGASFLRLDIPGPNDQGGATQYYAPGSVYAITVQHWELPALPDRVEDADLDDYSFDPDSR